MSTKTSPTSSSVIACALAGGAWLLSLIDPWVEEGRLNDLSALDSIRDLWPNVFDSRPDHAAMLCLAALPVLGALLMLTAPFTGGGVRGLRFLLVCLGAAATVALTHLIARDDPSRLSWTGIASWVGVAISLLVLLLAIFRRDELS